MEIQLPEILTPLCDAQRSLKEHFAHTRLAFTLDGKLVGDIGEAIAAQTFGLKLCEIRTPGVDAYTEDGTTSIQIKATGKENAGPAYGPGNGVADHLLFLRINFSSRIAHVAYNGPEAEIRALLPNPHTTTTRVRLSDVLALDSNVPDRHRLKPVMGQM